MPLDPWYKSPTIRKEVREGRAFIPEKLTVNRSRCGLKGDNV